MQNEAAVPQHTLAHYAANPDALANMTDEQLDALANAPAAPEANQESGEINGSVPPSTASQPATSAAPTGTETPPAVDAKGVQAKDGTHVIPYSVLERERDRAVRAEATANALSEQLKQLQDGKTPTAKADANAVALTDDDLAQLDQDLPDVAKAIRAQMSMIQALTGTVQSLQQEQEVQQNVKQQSVQDEIEAAITGNPDISAWRHAAQNQETPEPLMWNRAADLDAVLRSDPAWMDRPVAERFAKVAETIKTLYGAPSTAPSAPPSTATLQAKADAALAGAAKAGGLPLSSSDIPGGAAPPVDEAAALMDKSGPELTAAFMSMTPEQIEAKLSRLR
jgi:hypothetical protein